MILWDIYKTYDIRRTNLPLAGQTIFIVLAAQSHSSAPHLAGLFWVSDKPVAETSTVTVTVQPNRHAR
jgi:hypothetical protein